MFDIRYSRPPKRPARWACHSELAEESIEPHVPPVIPTKAPPAEHPVIPTERSEWRNLFKQSNSTSPILVRFPKRGTNPPSQLKTKNQKLKIAFCLPYIPSEIRSPLSANPRDAFNYTHLFIASAIRQPQRSALCAHSWRARQSGWRRSLSPLRGNLLE